MLNRNINQQELYIKVKHSPNNQIDNRCQRPMVKKSKVDNQAPELRYKINITFQAQTIS